MSQTIHYIENQYDNATKNNYKLMNIVNADHYDKLAEAAPADVDIEMLRAAYEPVHNDFKAKNIATIAADGTYKGWTAMFESRITELSSVKIAQWDIAIQNVHIKGTDEYIMILPTGRGPFQTGTYENRIDEVAALAERLNDFPALVATQTDIQNFHTTLETTRSTQQGKEGAADAAHGTREMARLECAKFLLGNTGYLMWKYQDNLTEVGNFFDWSLIKSGNTSTPDPEPTIVVLEPVTTEALKENPAEGEVFMINNTSNELVTICTGPDKESACPEGFTLEGGQEFTGTLEDMGLSPNVWLKATNASAQVVTLLFMVVEDEE